MPHSGTRLIIIELILLLAAEIDLAFFQFRKTRTNAHRSRSTLCAHLEKKARGSKPRNWPGSWRTVVRIFAHHLRSGSHAAGRPAHGHPDSFRLPDAGQRRVFFRTVRSGVPQRRGAQGCVSGQRRALTTRRFATTCTGSSKPARTSFSSTRRCAVIFFSRPSASRGKKPRPERSCRLSTGRPLLRRFFSAALDLVHRLVGAAYDLVGGSRKSVTVATPALSDQRPAVPANSSWARRCSRSAAVCAPAVPFSGSSTANSSPAQPRHQSIHRTSALSSPAKLLSASSPARCPRESLSV